VEDFEREEGGHGGLRQWIEMSGRGYVKRLRFL
jgi:hypothetical protein